jgi:hypothetical protein
MTIKYAEITIIRNIKDESIFTTLTRYFGNENNCNENDIIIITFDDDYICDIRDEYIDKKYTFGIQGKHHKFPIYFKSNKKETLFYKNPVDLKLNFNTIFKTYKKYKQYTIDRSVFNMIYHDTSKQEMFSILRIKSNEETPRFMLAYDDILFDNTDIIYLTDCIFKNRFS